MKRIFVVIPNWNGQDWISECIKSLEKQTISCSIVVVDNGSIDSSVGIIEKYHDTVNIIKLPSNTGFSGGVNVGIQYALTKNADYIALFNNDATADKNWLKELSVVLTADPKSGIAACKLLRSDETHFDSTGECYSIWGMPFPRGRNNKDTGQYDTPEYIFGASGGASMYRADMLKKIGLFDAKYFAYYEDVDMSFRAQLAGWNIVYVPTSRVYHRVSATSSKMGLFTRYHATKNFFILYTKNMPGALFWIYLPLFLIQSILLLGSSTLKGHGITYIKAYLKFITLLPDILKDRHNIQKNKKVTNQYIHALLYKHRPPGIHPFEGVL